MNALTKDRRTITRRIRDAWPTLEPLINSGYPLKDIWEDWDEFKVSYRHFIRTILKIRRQTPERSARSTAVAGKSDSVALPRVSAALPVAAPGQFDPLLNLRMHEAREKGFEYQGTRTEEELI